MAGSCVSVSRLRCHVSWVDWKLHQNLNQMMLLAVLC